MSGDRDRATHRFKPSRLYSFVRSRELEGTYPGTPDVGAWIVTAERGGAVMVRIDATGSHESSDPWEGIARLRDIQETIASRLRVLVTDWRGAPETRQLGDAFRNAQPQVTVKVPLRTDDAMAIRAPSAAEQVVRESIEASYRHGSTSARGSRVYRFRWQVTTLFLPPGPRSLSSMPPMRTCGPPG